MKKEELPCFVLPESAGPIPTHFMVRGKVRVQNPIIPPQSLSRILDRMIEERARFLEGLKTDSILEIIHKTAAGWLEHKDPGMKTAEKNLPDITGLSAPVVRSGLEFMLKELTRGKLQEALERSLGETKILDQFIPVDSSTKRFRKAVGPELTAHFLSGNIPGLGIGELVQSLISKSACFCKTSSREPLSAVLFARSLIRTEPRLAGCIAVMGWESGTSEAEEFEEVLFKRSELVTATGTDESVLNLRESWAGYSPVRSRFLGFGHRFSLGLVGRESFQHPNEPKETARKAARDVVLYDQQGCLSPHLFFVEEGGEFSPREFAGAMGRELERSEKDFPRGNVDPGTAARIQQERSVAEMNKAAGKGADLFSSSKGTDWTVIYETDPSIILSPLFRTVRVMPVKSLEDVIPLLKPWQPHLQAVGISVADNRILKLSEVLGNSGFKRICPLGEMQKPPADWSQDGHRFVADRLRWVDLEKE